MKRSTKTERVQFDPLMAIGSVDGRYWQKTRELRPIFSEFGLMRRRLEVEGEYLLALSEHKKIPVRTLRNNETRLVENLHRNFDLKEAKLVQRIETKGWLKQGIKKTNHDVNAIVRYIKWKLQRTSLSKEVEWTHFALTSEDVTNLAIALMLSNGLEQVILPTLDKISEQLGEFAEQHAALALLALTHCQPASPTTLGKEFQLAKSRLDRQRNRLWECKILAKLNGASGNYGAHVKALPHINWIAFTQGFVRQLNQGRVVKLKPCLLTNQTIPHETYSELFSVLMIANTVLIKFCRDMWYYIGRDWIVQQAEGDGSSAMPNKVNPLDFENAEGNLLTANALFEFFSRELPLQRLQRHLSDSTIIRNFGYAFGLSLIAYKAIIKGLTKISANPAKITEDLEAHPEVISEAIQIILRREKVSGAYDKLKDLTQGKKVTMELLHGFIDSLTGTVKRGVIKELKALRPSNYTGLAAVLAKLPPERPV